MFIDMQLVPHVALAYELCYKFKKPCKHVNFKFDDAMRYKSFLAGLADEKTNTVYINPYWWNNILDDQKEMLVFHEFGHLVLGKKHTHNPHDLMYQYGMDVTYYNLNRDQIIYDLFHK